MQIFRVVTVLKLNASRSRSAAVYLPSASTDGPTQWRDAVTMLGSSTCICVEANHPSAGCKGMVGREGYKNKHNIVLTLKIRPHYLQLLNRVFILSNF